MKHNDDWMVKCPYYKADNKQMIFCEGVREGTALHLAFDTHPNLINYKKEFCRGCWNQCLIAEALRRKWENDAQ